MILPVLILPLVYRLPVCFPVHPRTYPRSSNPSSLCNVSLQYFLRQVYSFMCGSSNPYQAWAKSPYNTSINSSMLWRTRAHPWHYVPRSACARPDIACTGIVEELTFTHHRMLLKQLRRSCGVECARSALKLCPYLMTYSESD
ncbi:hypothetical protein BDR03DRAFT_589207 [Suillus americanus]|nr:hypothetical protein BDR03DRAFT_589207 [Suillus americanus]